MLLTAPPTADRVLATPAISERGGGVSVVSRLVWRVFEDAWGKDAALISLGEATARGLSRSAKFSFGARVATWQMFRRARWMLFGHLGPARVQALFPRRFQRPYGVLLYGVEAWEPLRAADRRILRHAHLRIAISAHTAERVMRANPDIGEVVACPLSLFPEDEAAAAARADRLTSERDPIVLMVGRLNAAEAYKGHAEMIAAWPAVLAKHPSARLVIAGEGDDLGRLRDLARRTGVTRAVDFRGFVSREDLLELYARSAVFGLPSRGEGFGLVYLEAMAHRLPCIGSRHDAAGDVIVDGTTGFLVPPEDKAFVAHRINLLLESPALREEMGRAGERRWRETFTFARFSRQLRELIGTHLE